MIALIASALLGLYVFLPYIFFHRVSSLFIRLKKFQRTKTEEIVAGAIVAGLPFAATLLLFSIGWIGGCCVPYALVDSQGQKVSDYRTVFDAAYSDHYFSDHEQATWDALDRVYKRQTDFLSWNYSFLLIETLAFVLLTKYYWNLKEYGIYSWFAATILLPAVSEWHILLTDFTFPPYEKRSVKADIMSKDDMLYRGDVEQYFLDSAGDLSGLLLKNAQRFQYEKLKEERKSGVAKDTEQYWRVILGGGNFYLPNSNIASLNIRYTLPSRAYGRALRDAVKRLMKLKGVPNVSVQQLRRPRPTDQ
jgi:hypothetical protein